MRPTPELIVSSIERIGSETTSQELNTIIIELEKILNGRKDSLPLIATFVINAAEKLSKDIFNQYIVDSIRAEQKETFMRQQLSVAKYFLAFSTILGIEEHLLVVNKLLGKGAEVFNNKMIKPTQAYILMELTIDKAEESTAAEIRKDLHNDYLKVVRDPKSLEKFLNTLQVQLSPHSTFDELRKKYQPESVKKTTSWLSSMFRRPVTKSLSATRTQVRDEAGSSSRISAPPTPIKGVLGEETIPSSPPIIRKSSTAPQIGAFFNQSSVSSVNTASDHIPESVEETLNNRVVKTSLV